jgi:two-component system sensor histidine kinase KdpD
MNGTLVAEDTPGGGLTMVVTLPTAATVTQDPPASVPDPPSAAVTAD